jgi:hypothetical protein
MFEAGQIQNRKNEAELNWLLTKWQAYNFTCSVNSTGRISRAKDGRFEAIHTPLFEHSAPTNLGLFITPYEAYNAIMTFANRIESELSKFHLDNLENNFALHAK